MSSYSPEKCSPEKCKDFPFCECLKAKIRHDYLQETFKTEATLELYRRLKNKNERYEKALRDIQKHIELSLGETGAKMSTVWNICELTLRNKNQTPPPCPDCDHHYPECECDII